VSRLLSVLFVPLAGLAGGATIAVAATAPAVRTGNVSAVTPQTATIGGSINPHGVPTAYYFRYGTTNAYGKRTNTGDAGAGTSSRPVAAALTGLRPRTTYHYRLVAFSTAGTTRGADRTFRTPQIPTTLALSASPNPVVYAGMVSIAGSLIGPDVGGKKVALESNPFPFTGPFQQVGNSVVTTPLGAYGFVVPGSVTSQFRVVNQSKPAVTSATIVENVALAATLRVRRLHGGRRRVRFTGHVAPARVGNAVLFQRQTRRGWATVGVGLTRARTAPYSGFSRRLRLRRGGRYRALVRTTGGDYVDGTTRTVRVLPRRHHRR
jgi:hypothetical protein